jgi:hypothetical protein
MLWPMVDLGPPERLVLAASLCDLVPDLRDELVTLLRDAPATVYNQAWPIAQRHQTLALIARNLRDHGLHDRLPADHWAILEQLRTINGQRNTFLFVQARQIVDEAAKREIPVLVRKGLSLAQRAYCDLAARSMKDVDLLVRKADVRMLLALLIEMGFASLMPRDAQRMLIFGGLNYPTMSKSTHNPACPELQIGISVAYFDRSAGFSYDIDAVFGRADRGGDTELPTADEIDFFIDVCAHFFKDAKSLASVEMGSDLQLYRFSDVARLARRLTGRGLWPECMTRAETYNVTAPVYFALWYASRIDPEALPPDVEDRLRPADRGYLHTYGEAGRRGGSWPDEDVVRRMFDQSRAQQVSGTSQLVASFHRRRQAD